MFTLFPQLMHRNLTWGLAYAIIVLNRIKLEIMDLRALWETALGEIELNVSKANFITWFKNTKIHSREGGVITIGTPNGFTKEWLEKKHNQLIFKVLRNALPDTKEIRFVIDSQRPIDEIGAEKQASAIEFANLPGNQLNFQEFNYNAETNLNPRYTFDNFIIGSFNELAQAASRAVTKHLGNLYNPLFIYGPVGLGKTHLLQAIGNEIASKYPAKKIKYLSSEKYTGELVDAISKRGMETFKRKYHKIDVLIIDDIQFIAGKEKTQEEFFNTFNALYQKNKQIIISSDRPPKAIATLEERLCSRFEGGMIADISFPDLETRTAIIQKKASERNFLTSDEVLNYIATHVQKNIRELEGALNRIIAHAQVNNSTPTIENIARILPQAVNPAKKITNHKDIIKVVAEFYDIDIDGLINRSRKKELVHPRQIAMYLMREEMNGSYPSIGEKLGGRDHTTVMYAYQKIRKESENNETLRQEINLIKERLYN